MQRELALTAIALRRYELRHGNLPSELAALIPEFLPSLPHDWMDGKPLRYRRQPDGQFLLYSVGEDGVDDGGNARSTRGQDDDNLRHGRDWVWPMPASAQEIATDNEEMAKRRQRGNR